MESHFRDIRSRSRRVAHASSEAPLWHGSRSHAPHMDSVLQDLRYALRTLLRTPAFSAAAVLAIAVGVGGSSAMFSVLESVVLRPLAAPHPEELARLYEAGLDGYKGPWSPADYLDLAGENGSFESVAALRYWRASLTTDAGPEQLSGAKVSASFFAALGVHPALGRGFAAEEDYAGPAHVAVLTDALWKREFGGDRRILGQTVALDGRTYTVVGVMPRGFSFPLLRGAEVLLPLEMTRTDVQTR